MKRIFVSSVQKEFAEVRRLLKRYISKNPAYRRLFDVFVFEEDVVASDRRTDEVYRNATSILASSGMNTASRTRMAFPRPNANMTRLRDLD